MSQDARKDGVTTGKQSPESPPKCIASRTIARAASESTDSWDHGMQLQFWKNKLVRVAKYTEPSIMGEIV